MINWLGSQDRQTRFNAPPAFTTAYVRVPRYEARPLTKHGRIKVHNLNLRGRGAVKLSPLCGSILGLLRLPALIVLFANCIL